MIDFEEFYQGGELVEGLPHAGVPWDIGAPQPIVVAWQAAGRIRGHVLDAGCGTGDNAIFLASHGHRVTAVDIAPTAIETARARAGTDRTQVETARARLGIDSTPAETAPVRAGTERTSAETAPVRAGSDSAPAETTPARAGSDRAQAETAPARFGIDSVSPPSRGREAPTPIVSGRSDTFGSVEWVVGDSAAFTGQFDTVLASALIHCLPAAQRPGLMAALRDAAVDGALLNLTSLAVDDEGPFIVTEPELRTAVENAGWEITRFERDVIILTDVHDLPELPVWVVEATATSRGAGAATTP